MFVKHNNQGYQEKIIGVKLKTLAYGDKTLMASIKLSQGAIIPQHKHFHEQTGFLISGNLEFVIDGENFIVGPGDSWTILENVIHGVKALEESMIVEIFSPVRKDYLP
ncbi:MAG: cupin domain-containing protein [Chloroflexota bacterium]